MTRVALTAAALCVYLSLAACSDEPTRDEADSPPTRTVNLCAAAFEVASRIENTHDTHADLWPAFEACKSLGEFKAASDEYPRVLGRGVDPATYARNQCRFERAVKDSALCDSL